jgi:hypothetical protein
MTRTAGLIPRAEMTRRVERGAILLDRECPGWENEVDPASLRMDEAENCVLGQIHGDYAGAIEALFSGSAVEAAGYGFELARTGDLYASLAIIWRQQIDNRKHDKHLR